MADQIAKETNRTMFPEASQAFQSHAADYTLAFSQMLQFWKYLVQPNWHRMQCKDDMDMRLGTLQTPQNLVERLATWTAPANWHHPVDFEQQWLQYSLWGMQPLLAAQTWLQESLWPDDPGQCPGNTQLGMTWIEVALSLAMTLGSWLPAQRTFPNGKTYVAQPRSHLEAQQMQITLGEQSRTAFQLLTHYQALIPQSVLPNWKRCKVRSLQIFGTIVKPYGINLRPTVPFQSDMACLLKQYIPGCGGKFSSLPPVNFSPGFNIWPEDLATLQLPVDETQVFSKTAIREVKSMRSSLKHVSP